MYSEDSFFTLSVPGQIGLALISAAISIFVLWLCWKLCRGRKIWLRVTIGVALFIAFLCISPQLYYTYYIYLIEGLPWQIVMRLPPSLPEMFELMTFTGRQNMSLHSQGVLGWSLIMTAMLRR